MESVHDESLFTNHVPLLLGLILPKRSWTKKIAFGNKHYSEKKRKIWHFGQNDVQKIWCKKGESFLTKNTESMLKHEIVSAMFWGCF